MAIQMRRGYLKDFNPYKMRPGEWAVSIDTSTSNQVVWMCFAPGVCKRMGTYEDFKAQISEASDEIISQFIVQLTSASENLKNSTEQYIQGKVDDDWIPELQSYVNTAQTAANSAKDDAKAAVEAKDAASESERQSKISEENANKYSAAAKSSAENAERIQGEIQGVEERVSADKEAADLAASNAALAEKKASESEKNTKQSEINAKKSEDISSENALSAEQDAAAASESEKNAAESADIASQKADETLDNAAEVASNTEIATQKAKDAENSALLARSYTEGDTNLRPGEDVDSARFFYEQAKLYANTAKGSGLRPMGSIYFEQLSTIHPDGNVLYDILDDFVSDDRFVDGGGVQYGAGTEVYWTDAGMWNAMPGAGVAGIRGETESAYSKGLYTITKKAVGLEKVPNVTTNDQTPTFSISSKRENIISGEKLSVIMGKIMRFFSDLKTVAFTGKLSDMSGVAGPEQGGTGKTSLNDAANALINSLTTGTDTPTDADYLIMQSAGGGTTATTYHRKPFSALWNWIKSKLSTVAISGSYSDLSNRPSIPAEANNAKLTITQNGATKGTFTANASKDVIIALTDTNTNTDVNVTQTNTETNADYRVLLSNSADDTNKTEGAKKSGKLKFNPSTGLLTTTKVKADTESSTVTLSSSDVADDSAANWTTVSPITSGETHKSLFQKISTMFKNVRYLYKMLGNTDISAIGNGTVTDAISALSRRSITANICSYYVDSTQAGIYFEITDFPQRPNILGIIKRKVNGYNSLDNGTFILFNDRLFYIPTVTQNYVNIEYCLLYTDI